MSHTPGPWQCGQQHHTGGGEFYNANSVYQSGAPLESPAICSVYGLPINQTLEAVEEMAQRRKDIAVGLANARLIAAAPEMLEALKACVEDHEMLLKRISGEFHITGQTAVYLLKESTNSARAAIAKATGAA